jgi:hypothetical protein
MGALPEDSYCTVAEVCELLAGFGLGALGEGAELEARVEDLLPATKAQIDSAAGRDFGVHGNEAVVTDGTGHDCLFLFRLGRLPILAVRELRVEGETVPSDDYAVYADEGYLRLRPTATWGTRFPEGVANVEVDLDWGYETAPAEIVAAQAMLTGAQLLSRASSASGGGAVSKRLGDYAVRYAAEGPYAAAIGQWLDDVERTAARYRGVGIGSV